MAWAKRMNFNSQDHPKSSKEKFLKDRTKQSCCMEEMLRAHFRGRGERREKVDDAGNDLTLKVAKVLNQC